MRTRPFLKYFPVCHTIMVLLFLLYCKESHFGYKLFLVFFLQAISFTLFSWMIFKLEIPAQRSWNRDLHFVPTLNQPRAGLMPAFNLNWINGLPDEWAMMVPLSSRNKFSQRELALVDRDYELLNEYLAERSWSDQIDPSWNYQRNWSHKRNPNWNNKGNISNKIDSYWNYQRGRSDQVGTFLANLNH